MDQVNKTILISVIHSFVSKNILNSGVLETLKKQKDLKVVLLVPKIKKNFFENRYSSENVIVESVDVQSFVELKQEAWLHHLSRLLIKTHYLHYKRIEQRDINFAILGKVKYFLEELFVFIFAGKKVPQVLFLKFDNFLSRNDIFNKLLERHKPDLVFSTDIFDQADIQLIRESKSRKIKVIGMVRSWDNCQSKGLLRVNPDHVLVNNNVLKQELIKIHRYPSNSISVVGLPQFDSFINVKPEAKKIFFEKFGFDPNKKLIMFAPAGRILSDTDPDILDILVKAQQRGDIPSDVQFFIRNHPHHPSEISSFESTKNVHIQTPGQVLDEKTAKGTELTSHDLFFLRNILAHTDILLWVATSLCLDALVYDVPEIVVNFDGYKIKNYYNSVKKYHDEDHMKNMFAYRPFRIANNPDELVRHINTYLKDKKTDFTERELVRQQQLYKLDGKSSDRITKILINELRKLT